MTRINVGIMPGELCDQHLIAEYRELPRMVAFSNSLKGFPPNVPFTLGTGHMKSVVRFGGTLAQMHSATVEELRNRGFAPLFTGVRLEEFPFACRMFCSEEYLAHARPIVRDRIIERLRTMKRTPTWTKSTRPDWATL